MVPTKGADPDYDSAKEGVEAAHARLEEIREEWSRYFNDSKIEYWMPAGSTTEP